MVKYYKRLLIISLWHSYGLADAISGMVGMFLPPLAILAGISEQTMNSLAWQIPLCVFGTLAVVRIFMSPYWAHAEDSSTGRLLEQERDQLLRKVSSQEPNLAGEVTGTIYSNAPPEMLPGETTIAFFLVSVRNRGTPSIAEKWTASVRLADGRVLSGDVLWMGATVRLHEGMRASDNVGAELGIGTVREMREADTMWVKCSQPIATGAIVTGYLPILFRGVSVDELQSPTTENTISFQDILGKTIECSWTDMRAAPSGGWPRTFGDSAPQWFEQTFKKPN